MSRIIESPVTMTMFGYFVRLNIYNHAYDNNLEALFQNNTEIEYDRKSKVYVLKNEEIN